MENMAEEILELTEEEAKQLGKLHDPDEGNATPHYKWDEEIQREVIGLLLNDRFFLIQSVDLVQPEYFVNECHKALARIVFDHFKKYNTQPNKTQIVAELKQKIAGKEDKTRVWYLGEYNTVAQYYVPGMDTRDYYLDKITDFAKDMAMKVAFNKCLKLRKEKPGDEATWTSITSMLQEALSVDRNFDIGLDYFNDVEARYARKKEKIATGDFFVTGFADIDNSLCDGGLARGEIGSVTGLSGTGKSVFLVNSAICNLNRGKKVLYLSLEIDQDKCADRFDLIFANASGGAEGVSNKNLYDKKEVVFEALRSYVADKEDQTLLIVKQFPAGEMDMATFRAYYMQCKLNGFLPDLVIIDYVGEMKDYPGMATWESRPKLIRDLRGFAVMEQVCVLTAMQPKGSAREIVNLNGVIDDCDTGDAKAQNRPLDAYWSINQMNEEKECGLARLFVIKHRDGKSRFTCYIQIDYATLKMRQISKTKYDAIFTTYRNERTKSAEEVMRDEADLDKMLASRRKKSMNALHGAPVFNETSYADVEDAPEEGMLDEQTIRELKKN